MSSFLIKQNEKGVEIDEKLDEEEIIERYGAEYLKNKFPGENESTTM